MPDSSDSDGWIPLGDSAAAITWTPRKVDESEDAITNMFCGESFGNCVPEWAEDNGVTTAQVPLAVNLTLVFQGLTTIDGKSGETQAARFLERKGSDRDPMEPAFVQENLDPAVQHTLFMDFANSPSATVSISNFEIFHRPTSTVGSAPGEAHHSESLPKGLIPAIVAPAVIFVSSALVCVLFYIRKKRRRPRPHLGLDEFVPGEESGHTQKLQSYRAWSKHSEGGTTTTGSFAGDTDDVSDIAVLRSAMQRSGVSVWGLLASIARERNETHESLPSYGS
ncbi:hypothetical protein AURDEDRAFT_123819 [Auricularia subglabra TFB-10046 SS5]|nr:hypothetical protein AURDEDRAFT_123819 [Auricularia subglabra TFB-10046 SS5]